MSATSRTVLMALAAGVVVSVTAGCATGEKEAGQPESTAQSAAAQSRTVQDRSVELATSPNMRDVGGLVTADGKLVKSGVTFRSGELNKLDSKELNTLGALGLDRVLDLRTKDERAKGPDRLPDGVTSVHLDVLGATDAGKAAAGAGGAGGLEELTKPGAMEKMYQNLVSSDSARAAYKSMFEQIADAGGKPVLFHCTGGRDRAGWGAAALQTHLGVERQDVEADFVASNERLDASMTEMLKPYASKGVDVDKVKKAMELKPEFLNAAFAEIDRKYGSFDGYLKEGLGLSDDTLDKVRAVHLGA